MQTTIATYTLDMARSIGQTLGCELVVDVNEHSIEISMERPDTNERAWDPDLFHRGQLFISGYANPVKPTVDKHPNRHEPDTPEVEEGETDEESEERGVKLMPSARYKDYLDQHLLSELVRPEEQWKLMLYGLMALGVLQFIVMILVVYYGKGPV